MKNVLVESILQSVKKQVNVAPECTSFDSDLIISDDSATWSDFIPDNQGLANLAKTYTGTKVKIIFDPPTSSIVLEALKSYASELEWRLKEKAGLQKED